MKKTTVLLAVLIKSMMSVSAYADYQTREFTALSETGATKAEACEAARARVKKAGDAYTYLNGDTSCECDPGFVDPASPRPHLNDHWTCTVKVKAVYK
ncbi:MAG TPA: hypothetical protein VJ508_07945 [Saprospiraceae bacterium]|nr:hypothetical protein [Saprospiraceae bacterium]